MKIQLMVITAIIVCTCSCNKEESKLNITLHDKSLATIITNIQGSWKLQKVSGGICATCSSGSTTSYMKISGNEIVLGDKSGVNVDTIIMWKKDQNIFSDKNDSTYLLTLRAQKYYAFPLNYVVDRIENNTLILIDYASDPSYYYYSKQ